MRILTILARSGTEKYPDAERQIDDIFGRQLPDVERECLVVDNALPADHVTRGARRALIGGDNSFWEFSAFDRALEVAGPHVWEFDLVHLATSAFSTLYTGYLERFLPGVLGAVTGRPVCLGHIDCYNETIRVLSFRSRHWVRTSFLLLPPAELKALGSAVGVREAGRFFSGDPASPFRADAPISDTYRRLIAEWLGGGDIGQGVRWHSRIAASRDEPSMFEQKALAILNEHLFSIRLRAMGCRLIDVTWLSARLQEQPAAVVDWDTPWRRQLAERDRDRVVVP
jgi:hypothetical protein